MAEPSNKDLERLFAQLRRIEEHRVKSAEKEIQKLYKELLTSLQEYIGGEYARYAEDEILNITILNKNHRYGRFLEEVETQLNSLSAAQKKTIRNTVEELYTMAYEGMVKAVADSIDNEDLVKKLKGIKLTSAQVVKAATTNPVAKLTLNKTLEKHRKEIIYSIKKTITNGLVVGDRLSTMAKRIKNEVGINYRKAMLVARTETHRVIETGHNNASQDADKQLKDANAKYRMVKIWQSRHDNRVRHTRLANHVEMNGQIRLQDEDFDLKNGIKAPCPGQSGTAFNDCNCRCFVKRNLYTDDEYFKETGKHFSDFDTAKKSDILETPIKTDDKAYGEVLELADETSKAVDFEYIPVRKHAEPVTESEIISALCGGDMTKGSCASLGLCYIGQKQGYEVLDFRGGESQFFFSSAKTLNTLSQGKGIKTLSAKGKTSLTKANNLLKQCELDKEYFLCAGRHAAIVRRNKEGKLQYLELQSADKSGWSDFDGNPRYTLYWRFGCRSNDTSRHDFMIDITDSDFSNDEFRTLLGYLNTAKEKQRKGMSGTVK